MEPDNNVNDSLPKVMDKLAEIDGISIKDGLEFCGSPKALLKFLNTFYISIDEKTKAIKEAYDNKDISNYIIRVHALKSTSRIIGAFELSDMAKALEEAGESGNTSFIQENNDRLLRNYEGYKKKLSVLDEIFSGSDDNKPAIPKDILTDAYRTLRELIPAMDYDSVEMVLESMKKYKMADADKKKVSVIERLLKKLEWDELKSLIETNDSDK